MKRKQKIKIKEQSDAIVEENKWHDTIIRSAMVDCLEVCGTLDCLEVCGTLDCLEACGTLDCLEVCGTLDCLEVCGTLPVFYSITASYPDRTFCTCYAQ